MDFLSELNVCCTKEYRKHITSSFCFFLPSLLVVPFFGGHKANNNQAQVKLDTLQTDLFWQHQALCDICCCGTPRIPVGQQSDTKHTQYNNKEKEVQFLE